MLGTNDSKSRVGGNPREAVACLKSMAELAKKSGAKILIVAPAPMVAPIKYSEFDERIALPYCRELTQGLRTMTEQTGIPFLDAEDIVHVSPEDGVHLDASAHDALARRIASIVRGR